MIFASKTTFSIKSLKMLRSKFTKILQICPSKFCESRPGISNFKAQNGFNSKTLVNLEVNRKYSKGNTCFYKNSLTYTTL